MSKNIENLYMRKYKDEIVDTLFDLIRIPSFKGEPEDEAPFGKAPKAALEYFLGKADSLGFRTKNVDNYAGYAEFGPEDPDTPMIAAVCHLDVVPAKGWPDAFEPRFSDENPDYIIGRGSVDDKGPAVAVLYAMKSLMDQGYEPDCRIRLIVGTDEESGSECLEYYREHEEIPVAAFTADADFPVINGEKGHLTFDLVWDQMDSRPKEGEFRLYSADCGARPNVVPGEAVLKFQNEDRSFEEIETKGKMGHASTPDLYKNAIQYALEDAYKRSETKGVTDPFLEDYMQVLNTEYTGEGLGVDLSDEPSGDLTLNVGIFTLDDDEARLTIDIRYPVTLTADDVLSRLHKTLEKTGFHVENEEDTVPLYRPESDPLVKLLVASYNEVAGDNAKPKSLGGGTYARSLPNTIAFGANFPDNLYLGHAKFEYAKLSDTLRASEIFRIALQRMDKEYSK